MPNILWSPQPKQVAFMERPEYEALYGGSAGGGKSAALIAEAIRQVHIPHYRGILFRQTYVQLEHLIDETRKLYPRVFPGAKYNRTEKRWSFPSGAQIFFGYMLREDDKYNYQGKPYDFVGFDELTQFSQGQYMYLMSRNRPNGKGTRVYIRATANPGGSGHGWVKARFIDAMPPLTPLETEYEINDPSGKIVRMKRKRIFVPATVFDNQALLDNDPYYLANLAMLPEAERNALLYGDWSSFEGQFFREWTNDSAHYKDRLYTHVIDPFQIPAHWRIVRGFDWGYNKPFSVGWHAVTEDRKLYRIREWYGCASGRPDVGVGLPAHEIAREIKKLESTDPLLKGKQIYGIADPSIFAQGNGHGESTAQVMAQEGVVFSPADNSRILGWQQMHYRLAFDANGECQFQVFNTCRDFIRTIPALVHDDKRVEDVKTDSEDHQGDECVTQETLVLTSKGKRDILSLVGTSGYVYSHDGELHAYHDCRMTRADAEVYAVELEDGTVIKATANHPVLLTDGRYVPIHGLNVGDDVMVIEVQTNDGTGD